MSELSDAIADTAAKVEAARRPVKVAAGQLRMAGQVLAGISGELDQLARLLERTAHEEAQHEQDHHFSGVKIFS